MSKKIISLEQDSDGGINPGTNLFEEPIWRIVFEDDDERVLGKSKMEEYISKSYNKTVYRFKRWKVSTLTSETYVYVIVFTDRTHEMVSPVQLRDIVYRGHSVRNEEKYNYIETELTAKGGLSPIFIPDVQESV
jgi:uncharacterized DUF497 family protein